ncbi:MAG: hypothetical protein MJZ81_03850 [Bacteroidales bacterium]|nr:hypothetical protein [Bacteroidales bacterium]
MENETQLQQKPARSKAKRFFVWTILVVILFLVGLCYFKFYFVFGEGVKAGELNYMVHKGYIWKTNEGKIIQSGFKGKAGTAIQSYEFEFSVADQRVADSLMRCTSKTVELHYKEYKGMLPWRGMSRYVVDSIYSVQSN